MGVGKESEDRKGSTADALQRLCGAGPVVVKKQRAWMFTTMSYVSESFPTASLARSVPLGQSSEVWGGGTGGTQGGVVGGQRCVWIAAQAASLRVRLRQRTRGVWGRLPAAGRAWRCLASLTMTTSAPKASQAVRMRSSSVAITARVGVGMKGSVLGQRHVHSLGANTGGQLLVRCGPDGHADRI